ncbi:MAG: hypothetical protein C4518_12750 [Desulfobacteraceae bacterium]|nr:MAG: hypothetical protein C4518_12750 [Desulfobacteraceae bacterium]
MGLIECHHPSRIQMETSGAKVNGVRWKVTDLLILPRWAGFADGSNAGAMAISFLCDDRQTV